MYMRKLRKPLLIESKLFGVQLRRNVQRIAFLQFRKEGLEVDVFSGLSHSIAPRLCSHCAPFMHKIKELFRTSETTTSLVHPTRVPLKTSCCRSRTTTYLANPSGHFDVYRKSAIPIHVRL